MRTTRQQLLDIDIKVMMKNFAKTHPGTRFVAATDPSIEDDMIELDSSTSVQIAEYGTYILTRQTSENIFVMTTYTGMGGICKAVKKLSK